MMVIGAEWWVVKTARIMFTDVLEIFHNYVPFSQIARIARGFDQSTSIRQTGPCSIFSGKNLNHILANIPKRFKNDETTTVHIILSLFQFHCGSCSTLPVNPRFVTRGIPVGGCLEVLGRAGPQRYSAV